MDTVFSTDASCGFGMVRGDKTGLSHSVLMNVVFPVPEEPNKIRYFGEDLVPQTMTVNESPFLMFFRRKPYKMRQES